MWKCGRSVMISYIGACTYSRLAYWFNKTNAFNCKCMQITKCKSTFKHTYADEYGKLWKYILESLEDSTTSTGHIYVTTVYLCCFFDFSPHEILINMQNLTYLWMLTNKHSESICIKYKRVHMKLHGAVEISIIPRTSKRVSKELYIYEIVFTV
jgi:hypothetical protein